MIDGSSFALQKGWQILLKDLGINPTNVLRRAGLPEDLFARTSATISTAEYFNLLRGIEAESGDRALPLKIGQALSAEAFDPPIFAALCSPNWATAIRRLARFKRLIGPMTLLVEENSEATTVAIDCLDKSEPLPPCLIALELVFMVQLARMGTREKAYPVRVVSTVPLEPMEDYTSYFGIAVCQGEKNAVAFARTDAVRPFLTVNDKMWQFFEPELRQRLSEIETTATISERVRGILLEMLPSGRSSIREVARILGVSTRSLQRHLKAENTSFQNILSSTRAKLAFHYLKNSSLSGAEISLLLGFDNPSSFFRFFHQYTGKTTEQIRF